MILDEITLHDFGVYAKQQKIELTPPTSDKPITLFGGLNGAGKTTLLDAMQLCLFGQAAPVIEHEDGSYQENIARRINKRSRWQQSSVSLVFRHTKDGEEIRYRVTRTWRKTASGVQEKLSIIKNKKISKILTENWAQYVEEILPSNLARLFFFDGEKIEAYADPENARALVQTAVHNLLGMDAVEQLQKDLQTLERRRQVEKMPETEADKIAEKQQELKELQKKITKLKENQAQLLSREIDPINRELVILEKNYEEAGGDLRDRRDAIERTAQNAGNALTENKTKMLVLAESRLPLILVQKTLKDIKKLQLQANKKQQACAILDVLKKRDAAMLEHVRRQGGGKTIISELQKFCQRDLRKIKKDSNTPDLIDMGEKGEFALNEFLRVAPERRKDAQKLIGQHQLLVESHENAKLAVASIPQEDILAGIIKKRSALSEKLEGLKDQYNRMREETERETNAAKRLQLEIDGMWERHAEATLAHEEKERFLLHTRGARETLAEFKKTVLRERIERIEKLVLESYQSLLHKDTLAGQLRIDPESFNITLYDEEKHPIAPEQLSAGERQLLAISLLWGMAKSSRKTLPTAIDTPLGRLDSKHRNLLVERYFGFASHQVLLFSTDEEISGDYLARLQPWIGNFYKLNYDNALGATTVVKGDLNNA